MAQPIPPTSAPLTAPLCRRMTVLGAGVTMPILLAAAVLHAESDIFRSQDLRVFKTRACTRDHQPIEALYYIAASRADLAAGKPSPSSALMKESVDDNWQRIASRLTGEQVMDERQSAVYNRVLSELIPQLQQAVEEQSGVRISIEEVNSRIMDPAKDQDVPACGAP